ncbi:hypothetical protein C8R43DRAFT_1230426 [Mycena crocata]|nr:hypothetical protein C8R43DRAFT_1230426 [Mycena crocata]
MFFSFALLFATLAALSTGVTGMPKPEQTLSGRAPSCPPGNFYSSTAPPGCRVCPAGNTCNGNQAPQPCDYGSYQPSMGATVCIKSAKGFYQPQRGQNVTLPCYIGSYQPYPGQKFCYGAPSGRFQGKTGQAGVCGSCCGWATSMTNFNTGVFKCTTPTPFSGRASGSGCVKSRQGCDPVAPCAQAADGTCRTILPPVSLNAPSSIHLSSRVLGNGDLQPLSPAS